MRLFLVVPLIVTVGCAGAAAPVAPKAPETHVATSNQIITPTDDSSEPELFKRAQHELLDGDYQAAKRDFETLLAAEPSPKILPTVLFDLGNAYEALGERDRARDAYHKVADKFPELPVARAALLRVVWLHAYLEEWKQLGETAEALLARSDLERVDRVTALGARALSRVEQGDESLAMRDVQSGLDLVDELGLGRSGRLPPAGAQLKFALAEVRRVTTERITLQPADAAGHVGPDFVARVSARCQGLLDAQSAYGDAMRSEDPHWATMSGYRLGAMYRQLHRELMAIPPDAYAKTEHQRQVFYGIMHVRYRALLDKGLIMLNATLDVADKTGDTSSWVTRAREAKAEMDQALAEEKAALAKLPFTEGELERALQIMQEKAEKAAYSHAR
jgi:tetratricopeptide (TPR) repeat protein